MTDSRLRSVLAEIDHLRSMVSKIIDAGTPGDTPLSQQVDVEPPRPEATASTPSPEVAELLETIKRTVADPKARKAGYTLVLALLEPHSSTVGCVSETDMEGVLEADEDLVRFAVAFTNPGRLRIIRALARDRHTSSELSVETGLVGGQLYHHLKELMRSGFVIQEARDSYMLSPWIGAPAYLGMNLLTRTITRAAGKRRGGR